MTPWNKKAKDQLEELILKGHTMREVSEIMGKTKNSIIGMCHRSGFKAVTKEKSGPKIKVGLTLITDIHVLAEIKKHTDNQGWGLEFDEVSEYTGYKAVVIMHALKNLIKFGYVRSCTSFVADHVFYNDATIKQIGV